MRKTLTESSNQASITASRKRAKRRDSQSIEIELASTLIEFPGSRNVPEWRKRLTQRVREVQEQKAREAADTEAAIRAAETVSCVLPSGQLELVPDPEQAPLNPIVSKALKRVDRARRGEHLSNEFSTSALAPEPERVMTVTEATESKPKLSIVTPVITPAAFLESDETEQLTTDRPRRVGVISARVEDAALSYVDACLSTPALSTDTREDIAGLSRRALVGIIDLVFISLLISPAVAVIRATSGDWSDPRVVGLIAGASALAIFAYLTISIALTGRTFSMRLLGVRTIDARTGLIPTGAQSLKRAVGYIFSLAVFGLGLAVALIDREHRTLHDRFSQTIVIRD